MMFEVFVRRLYYSSSFLQKCKKNKRKKIVKKRGDKIKKEILYTQINKTNITTGDLVIVHSSMDALNRFDIKPKEIIDFLLSIIGDTGTLVMPAFPVYKTDVVKDNKTDHIYNTKLKLCSTGVLANIFLRYPGVIRSKYPYNTLAAYGPLADDMMKDNLNSPFSFGTQSSWYFCKKNNAKILFLGVPSNRTTTIVHVAEDYLDDKWPIRNWYVSRNMIIKDGTEVYMKEIKIRNQFWSRYNASYFRTQCLKNEGILNEWEYEGVSFGIIENSSNLVDYIVNRAKNERLFFKVPKKFWRKKN